MSALFVGVLSSAFAESKLDSSLAGLAAGGRSESVSVIVFLTRQPGPVIGQRVRAMWEPRIESVAAHLRALSILRRPAHPISTREEQRLVKALQQRAPSEFEVGLALEMDALTNKMVDEISKELLREVEPDHREMAELVEANGGSVTSRIAVMNAVAARVPANALQTLAADSRIALIAMDNPGFPELDVSAPTVGAPTFWGGGIQGGGFDAGVLDTGVQQNHPAFVGKLFESNAGTTDSNGHGTSMASIMASNHATYKGMAPLVGTICVAIAGNDATSMTGMNYLVTGTVEKPEAINYSFGNGTANVNDYANIDRFFDGVIDTFGPMVAKSTGNGGFGSGTPTITHPAPAYNLMASANMNDNNTTNRTDDRINSSSSRGPTVSGRKKPDITAPGTSIVSANPAGTFVGVTGTSPASPHTGGSIILLKHAGVNDVRAAKAILLNNTDAINDNGTSATTDDVWVNGSLWNRRYGWGYLNLTRAFAHTSDFFLRDFAAPVGGARRFKLFKGTMLQHDKATLVWNRHVAYNGAAYPTLVEDLSNLDLKGFDFGTNALVGSSLSTIDNVEQFSVAANTASTVLKVYSVGNFDPQVPTERWALATEEGFGEAVGPQFQVEITQTGDFEPGSVGTVQVKITNTGDLPAHATNVTFQNMTTVGSPTQSAGVINPGQAKFVNFSVNIPNIAGDYLVFANVESNSYEETWTKLQDGAVEVR